MPRISPVAVPDLLRRGQTAAPAPSGASHDREILPSVVCVVVILSAVMRLPAAHAFTPIDGAFLEVELAGGLVLGLDQDAVAHHVARFEIAAARKIVRVVGAAACGGTKAPIERRIRCRGRSLAR